jgi:hypothetical protein
MMEVPTLPIRKAPDVSHATFLPPELTTFRRLDGLGFEAAGQRLAHGRAVLECHGR